MRTAKYHVEWKHSDGWTNEAFPDTLIRHSRKAALDSMKKWADDMGKHFVNSTWRVRTEKGRVIARWVNGKRVQGTRTT